MQNNNYISQAFFIHLTKLSYNISLFIVLFSIEPFLAYFNHNSTTGLPVIIFISSTFLALLSGYIGEKYLKLPANKLSYLFYTNFLSLSLVILLLGFFRHSQASTILFILWLIYCFSIGLLLACIKKYFPNKKSNAIPNVDSMLIIIGAFLTLLLLYPLYPYIKSNSLLTFNKNHISTQNAWLILFSYPLLFQIIPTILANKFTRRLITTESQLEADTEVELNVETNWDPEDTTKISPLKRKILKSGPILIYMLFSISGTLLIILSLLYIPAFINSIGKLETTQSKAILYYALLLSLPILLLLYIIVWRWGKYLLWLGILGLILAAWSYKPTLDNILILLNPNAKTELVDKHTENIKTRHYFSRTDSSKYLYSIRKTSSKQYYDNGLILSTTKLETIENGRPKIHLGKVPNFIQKQIDGQLIFIIALKITILIACALMILMPLNSNFLGLKLTLKSSITQILIICICTIIIIIAIASTHLTDPKLSLIFGTNNILIGIYTVISTLSISAIVSSYLLWQKIPLFKIKKTIINSYK